ncbi:hypothetical protein [Xylanimonas ulmi]
MLDGGAARAVPDSTDADADDPTRDPADTGPTAPAEPAPPANPDPPGDEVQFLEVREAGPPLGAWGRGPLRVTPDLAPGGTVTVDVRASPATAISLDPTAITAWLVDDAGHAVELIDVTIAAHSDDGRPYYRVSATLRHSGDTAELTNGTVHLAVSAAGR